MCTPTPADGGWNALSHTATYTPGEGWSAPVNVLGGSEDTPTPIVALNSAGNGGAVYQIYTTANPEGSPRIRLE